MKKSTFRRLQIVMPLLPIPLGCYFLYKALASFNRNPPPIATDSQTVLSRPLYAEPVYKARRLPAPPYMAHATSTTRACASQSISYSPSAIARNMSPREPR